MSLHTIYRKYIVWGLFMIVLKKKRLLYMISCIIIAVFAFSFKIGDKKEVLPVVALPISNKVIIIDAGHRSSG